MRVKKKRAPKPKTELTEEERLQVQARALAEGRIDNESLNDSVYSYYTEKTDLNESNMMMGAAGQDGIGSGTTSPDKRARSPDTKVVDAAANSNDPQLQNQNKQGGDVKILAELEPSVPVDSKLESIEVKDVAKDPAQMISVK